MQQRGISDEESAFPELFADHIVHSLYTHYLARLIACCQRSYETKDYRPEQIAKEIALLSHDAIQLYLHPQPAATYETMVPYVPMCRPFLARWGNTIYGSLQCKVNEESGEMVLPTAFCERLARDCAWCLHLLEQEVQRQQQQQISNEEARQKVHALSTAQFTVLQLMVKGLSTRAIAERLHLSKRTIETHQHCIYQELDVHSQREATLIGLAAGLSTS